MAVNGHVHDSGVLLKNLLRAVAMMDIPVQNEHPLSASSLHAAQHSGAPFLMG